jgi:UDP-N-acetylmuramate--alanine ligase
MKTLFHKYHRVHMVGIAGAGMEGLARILSAKGCCVTGTDSTRSDATDALERDGFDIQIGHRADFMGDADLVVYSAAVPSSNEELQVARRRGIDVVGRAELLGEIARTSFTIAIAGTHGKTTTSAMLASILDAAGLEPAVAIGGYVKGHVQGRWTDGAYFVVEADEFDRSFLKIYPNAAVVTSIEAEHLDSYGDEAGVQAGFVDFLHRLPFYGQIVLAGESGGVRDVMPRLARIYSTYGIESDNRFHPVNIKTREWGTGFELFDGDENLADVEINVPGRHNLANAVGAAAMARLLGIGIEHIVLGLRNFVGLDRRFECKGKVRDVLIVDDYAHHPAEVAAALATARSFDRRVIAIFQPHLYSRTRDFFRQFGSVLSAADQVFIADIYPAREAPIDGINSDMIVNEMRALGYTAVELEGNSIRLVGRVVEQCRAGDLVLTMGAGDIGRVSSQLMQALGGGKPSDAAHN